MTWTPEQILHDRSTRGEKLTPGEQAQLDAWYAELNRQESQAIFGQNEPPISAATVQKQVVALQAQVDESLIQLRVITQRLQEVSSQNQQLRRKNAILRAKIIG